MTISNAGSATVPGIFPLEPNTYNVTGAGSGLVTGSAEIDFGAQVSVAAGASMVANGAINIGHFSSDSAFDSLTVDGLGSSVQCNATSTWKLDSNHLNQTVRVTFRNGATGSFGTINMGGAFALGGDFFAEIGPDADLAVRGLTIGQSSSLGIVNDSTVAMAAGFPLMINGGLLGVGTGGALIVGAGGSTHLNGGPLNIAGGTADLKTLTVSGGVITFSSGSLTYIGNLTVGAGGLLGSDLTLESDRQLTLSGTTTIDPSHTLTLSGGTLNTGSLVVNGTFTFTSGTLGITGPAGLTIGAGGPLGSSFVLNNNQILNVTSTLTVNVGATLTLNSVGGLSVGNLVNNGSLVATNSAIRRQAKIPSFSGTCPFTLSPPDSSPPTMIGSVSINAPMYLKPTGVSWTFTPSKFATAST
jgi:hypothetical protein